MSAAGYYNYDGVWLAASATPLKTIWGVGTATISAANTTGAVKLYESGYGEAMIGGAGDTTFVVNNINDVITANTSGVDTVVAGVNYVLPTGVQNLTLNGTWNDVVGVGNGQANIITADKAGETIVPMGGDSVLVSAGGGDTFLFTPGAGKDVIVNFHTGSTNADVVRLPGYGFTSFAAVQGAMTQQGSDVILKLSSSDLIDFRNTTISAFTADNFQIGVDTAGKAMSFDEEFNSLSLYNASTGTGVWKTNFAWGIQKGLDSHTILNSGEEELFVDPSFAGTGSTALGLNPFSISNGVVSISANITPTADKGSLWNYNYYSGLLSTEKSFSQTYGYFEIKAEMPQTPQGLWPAFWMMPVDGSYSSELDVFEEIGTQANTIYNTIHWTPNGATSKSQTQFTTYVPNLMSGFHTYGVLWTPSTITWYVDGAAVAQVATPDGMNKPMYMVINMAVGGNWPGSPTAATKFPSSYKIDYVHAYTLAQVESGATPVATPTAAAAAPTSVADAYTAKAGAAITVAAAQGVLANDVDNNGLKLTAALAKNGGPSHGTVTLNADGSFTYTPTAGFAGTDSFTYVASDSQSTGAATKVTLTVNAAAPTVKAATFAATAGVADVVSAAQGVLAGAVDNNGLTLTAALAKNGGPSHGTLTLNADGSFTYTANAGYVGTDSFTYVASDSLSSSVATTVTLNVTNSAPVVVGGRGNDTYYVHNSAEQIVVAAGTPNETVISTVSYALPANIQNLVLQGSGLTGVANNLNDSLTSLGGPNTLVGGTGVDTFYVNNVGDKVVVANSVNGDLIVSSVSYTLPTNVHSLALSGTGLTATGNAAGGNYLISSSGGNTLVGSAKGNDTFIVSHANDVIQVAAGAVNDTVNAYSSFALPANVQKLVGEGAKAITLVGNSAANTIVANSGADTLTGGGGADTFVVAPGQKMETITDFSVASGDKIDISAYQAKGLNPSFHDFGAYSTVTFSSGETITLLGVHASSLSVSGHYIV